MNAATSDRWGVPRIQRCTSIFSTSSLPEPRYVSHDREPQPYGSHETEAARESDARRSDRARKQADAVARIATLKETLQSLRPKSTDAALYKARIAALNRQGWAYPLNAWRRFLNKIAVFYKAQFDFKSASDLCMLLPWNTSVRTPARARRNAN